MSWAEAGWQLLLAFVLPAVGGLVLGLLLARLHTRRRRQPVEPAADQPVCSDCRARGVRRAGCYWCRYLHDDEPRVKDVYFNGVRQQIEPLQSFRTSSGPLELKGELTAALDLARPRARCQECGAGVLCLGPARPGAPYRCFVCFRRQQES